MAHPLESALNLVENVKAILIGDWAAGDAVTRQKASRFAERLRQLVQEYRLDT